MKHNYKIGDRIQITYDITKVIGNCLEREHAGRVVEVAYIEDDTYTFGPIGFYWMGYKRENLFFVHIDNILPEGVAKSKLNLALLDDEL